MVFVQRTALVLSQKWSTTTFTDQEIFQTTVHLCTNDLNVTDLMFFDFKWARDVKVELCKMSWK